VKFSVAMPRPHPSIRPQFLTANSRLVALELFSSLTGRDDGILRFLLAIFQKKCTTFVQLSSMLNVVALLYPPRISSILAAKRAFFSS
jgi:hypothetical protein